MNTQLHPPSIKSWPGLFFGLFCSGFAFWTWIEYGELQHLIAGLGFACWMVTWSQLEISFKKPLLGLFEKVEPLSLTMSRFATAGFLLMLASLVMRLL